MRRLQKSQCGYDQYKCTGITSLPIPNPICCDNRIEFSESNSRTNDNNFYNIPSRFQGIVQQTPYIDLSDIVQSNSVCCEFHYDPFNQEGFKDLFDDIKGKLGNYANSLASYGCSDSSYNVSDAIQKPGFLLPTPELNDFYPATLQAIPTVALASPVNSAQLKKASSIKSACTGFQITAVLVDRNLTIDVTPGRAIVYQNGNTIHIGGNNWTQTIQSDSTINTQIYVAIWYDFEDADEPWIGTIVHKTDENFSDSTIINTPLSKLVQIGAVRVEDTDVVQVIQQVCSPVDMRDWVSQVSIPQSRQNLFLFSYSPGSTKMKWHPVKDC